MNPQFFLYEKLQTWVSMSSELVKKFWLRKNRLVRKSCVKKSLQERFYSRKPTKVVNRHE